MIITVTKENLKKGLAVVSRVVGVGNPLQILNNILFKTDEGRLKLSSTNLEIGINTWVGGKIEEEGSLTVPARLITDYINNLPTDKVVLKSKDNSLFIDSQNYQTTIKGLPSEDFPLIPQITNTSSVKIDSEELKGVFAETIWAASQNETQPEISGVFISFEGNKLKVAATDRYRLAERQAVLKSNNVGQKDVIVPIRTVNELYKTLTLGKGELEIMFSETQVLFRHNETEIISRLIDGNYPDYKQIVPKDFKTEVLVEREELLHAIKATSFFASESNNIQIKANVEEGLVITASSTTSGENTTKVKAKTTGAENAAVFNYKYLMDCLGSLKEKSVMFKMINDNSPAMVVPDGRSNYLYIVMPIKL